MKTALSAASVGVQGSGWGWLGYDKAAGSLRVAACPNQVPLFPLNSKSNGCSFW